MVFLWRQLLQHILQYILAQSLLLQLLPLTLMPKQRMRLATTSLPIGQHSSINPIPHKILNLPLDPILKNILIGMLGLVGLIETVRHYGFWSDLFYFVLVY